MHRYAPITTAADFAREIRLGSTRESICLEFKTSVERQKPKAALELARDVAQFANTLGGCLVFGVSETTDADGRRVAQRVTPLASAETDREFITNAVANYLVPNTIAYTAIPIDLPNGEVVLVVNVAPSAKVVTVFDRQNSTIQFVRRNSHGKTYHNPDELEGALMDGSRAKYLSVLAAVGAEPHPVVVLASAVHQKYTRSRWMRASTDCRITVCDEGFFGLSVGVLHPRPLPNPIEVRIPYGLVREVWRVHDVVWMLLSIELHVLGNEFRFGPPPESQP